MEVKSEDILDDMQRMGYSGYSLLCLYAFLLGSNLHVLEAGFIRQRQGCASNLVDSQERDQATYILGTLAW